VIESLKARIDDWFVTTLPGVRGATAARLRTELLDAGVAPSAIHTYDDPATAFRAARERCGEADRILVFGSFLTVAAALAASMSGSRAVNATTLPHG
jgi:dihydrofolate synthase/folylpolyglutamate synthase